MTESFWVWRAIGKAKAIADHQQALADVHKRLSLLHAQVQRSLADDEGLG